MSTVKTPAMVRISSPKMLVVDEKYKITVQKSNQVISLDNDCKCDQINYKQVFESNIKKQQEFIEEQSSQLMSAENELRIERNKNVLLEKEVKSLKGSVRDLNSEIFQMKKRRKNEGSDCCVIC